MCSKEYSMSGKSFEHKQIVLYKIAVYLGITAAIWLAAQPWRLRDFFAWMLAMPSRTRAVGGALTAYVHSGNQFA